jgi:hypothetical protein
LRAGEHAAVGHNGSYLNTTRNPRNERFGLTKASEHSLVLQIKAQAKGIQKHDSE